MVKRPKLKQFTPVRILWEDPCGLPGEWLRPRLKQMQTQGCVTVGQVYRVFEDRITVICTWDPSGKNAHGGMTIPFSVISKIEELG